MKGFKKFLVAGIAAGAMIAGSSTFATAADFEAPVEVPSWTAFWIGGGFGYGFVNHELGADYIGDNLDAGARLSGIGGEGWMGRIGGGYDYQFDSSEFVVGIFGDYTFSDIDTKATLGIDTGIGDGPALSAGYKIETENSWFVGGRVGYLVNPDTLIYGLVGYSEIDFKARGFLEICGDGCQRDGLRYGWTQGGIAWGGGVETKITENITAKLEYRYQDLDRKTIFAGRDVFDDGDLIRAYVDTNVQSVMATVNWRF